MSELESRLEWAERIRRACLDAARQGYQDASQSGLCSEGALEVALSAIEMLDLKALAANLDAG